LISPTALSPLFLVPTSLRSRPRPGPVPVVPTAVTGALLEWYRTHRRPLPWRRDHDPYRLWVAEVLLQQTHVAQAAPYFERFVARFPTLDALARADLSEVLKVWQGAGYYARARNLHAAARVVQGSFAGALPSTVPELESLPGVGSYIARALASMAHDVPEVALEANGLRVAARWTREKGDVRSGPVRARLLHTLESLLPASRAGEFNEALMELGETVCLPVSPDCPDCPVRFGCRAGLELEDPGSIPYRRSRPRRPHVEAAVVVLEHRGRWLVQRRPTEGLLGGLWEFPGGKVAAGETPADAARRELLEETGIRAPKLTPRGVVRHGYSHFSVTLHVFWASLPRRPPVDGLRWVTPDGLARLPLPKATEKIARMLDAGPGTASPDSGYRPGRMRTERRAAASRPAPPARVRGTPASRVRPRARH
jgi:A/G-specific adenine glycosylase